MLLQMSCQQQNQTKPHEATKDTLSFDDEKNINSIGVLLSDEVKKAVEHWSQYKSFTEVIEGYLVVSNAEALENAERLKQYADTLKMSFPPNMLDNDELKARINILNSECSRLADMSNIPSITEKEVKRQVEQVLSVYGMLNSKINAIYNLHELQSELSLDPDFEKMLKDLPEPNIDSVSIKQEPGLIKPHRN